MTYPVLLTLVSDVAEPAWRASALGGYRLWRDSGYAVGTVATGIVADNFGIRAAILAVAGLAFVSGLVVVARMRRSDSRMKKRSTSGDGTFSCRHRQ